MLIDLNMNPLPQGGFIVAQDRSFLKPRRSGKSGTSQIVSFEHAKASAALAASCKRACGKRTQVPDYRHPENTARRQENTLRVASRRSHAGLFRLGLCAGSVLNLKVPIQGTQVTTRLTVG